MPRTSRSTKRCGKKQPPREEPPVEPPVIQRTDATETDDEDINTQKEAILPDPQSDHEELCAEEGSQPADKKRKIVTDLTPEQEEDMIQWLRDHPVLWNKKLTDYKDITLKDALWQEQAN